MFSSLAVGLLYLSGTTFANPAFSVIECLTKHDVPFETSCSSNWTDLILPYVSFPAVSLVVGLFLLHRSSYSFRYNLRLSWEPSIVTLPYTSDHVSRSVTCAAAAGLKVQAKSGGHSYASFSTGGQDGSLIVNLQNFNSIKVDGALFFC
jgi:hypothetical protein